MLRELKERVIVVVVAVCIQDLEKNVLCGPLELEMVLQHRDIGAIITSACTGGKARCANWVRTKGTMGTRALKHKRYCSHNFHKVNITRRIVSCKSWIVWNGMQTTSN